MRFNLTVETFGTRLVGGEKMPLLDIVKSLIAEELGTGPKQSQELGLAIASLLFGTVRGMIAAGVDTDHARQLKRTSISALRKLLEAFSEREPARRRSKAS
jgi:hypothetical protein